MFFEEYFAKRGEDVKPDPRGEVMVRCPFPHDKGLEEHASASFNVNQRIYKCFACAAEDRERGMGETSFVAKIYGTDYDNAAKLKSTQINVDTDKLATLTDNLLKHVAYKNFLNERGISDESIIKYKLGYKGSGIVYPIILDGILFDERTYNTTPEDGEPKIRSVKFAKPLLFPYDDWVNDIRDTLFCAGENDTILARQFGFNAVESTMGEGSIPMILLSKFKNRKVFIVYDCDEAGQKSSSRLAFYLKDAGADVYIVNLGLLGTKEDKDITDYFMKHNKQAVDLQKLMDISPSFTQEEYMIQKNKEFELVELWNVKNSRYSDKYISSRVMQMGHFDLPIVDIPSHIEWECRGETDATACMTCPKKTKNKSGEWSLGPDTLGSVLELVEVTTAEQKKAMKRLCGIPSKCPNSRMSVISKKHVEKVILSPDVESESEESGYQLAELHAWVINGNTEDGNKYRIYFKRVPHPKDQSIMLVVDKYEESDNAINSFKVTPEFIESMKPWQGDPFVIMKKRYEELGKHAVGDYLPESIFYSSELVYHGILDFRWAGKYIKGHPEGLLVGASRTGKSEVGKAMSVFYGLGNVTECKNASVAGLIGGVDKGSNGTFRISWGEIPRNHKGLVFLDEISGMHPEVFKHLTGVRSEREAIIAKIKKGRAPAKTRLLWVGNPRTGEDGRSRNLYDYNSGVDVCLDLFPADEDVSRFDFIVLVPEPEHYISPFNDDGSLPEKPPAPTELKQLIRWAWSRKRDQVIFDTHVEKYIEHTARLLDSDFGSTVKIVGIEGTKKIARMATSIAACCFSSSNDGECVVVKKEHVDWVRNFLINCYDNEIFKLKEYVESERKLSTTNDEINLQVAGFVKKYPMIIKLLLEQQNCPHYNLQNACGVVGDEYKYVTSMLFTHSLVTATPKGMSATRRLRKAVDVLRMKKADKKQVPVVDTKPRSFSEKINLK